MPAPACMCSDQNSGCENKKDCKIKTHISCDCPLPAKVPKLELEWLYHQRNKIGEKSAMMIVGGDEKETKRQVKAEKRKQYEEEVKLRKEKKMEELECSSRVKLMEENRFINELENQEQSELLDTFENSFCEYNPPSKVSKQEQQEANLLVDWILEEKLGNQANLVKRYLDRPLKRNMLPIPNLSKASLRFDISPGAAAACAASFLQDLIEGGYLSPDMAYLACDPSKVRRGRKEVMATAKVLDSEKYKEKKITGLSYDGRKDLQTLAMVPDSHCKLHRCKIQEEHVSVTDEPSGKYLAHFVPDDPLYPEKPAQKNAEALFDILESHGSVETLNFLGGDSTAMNTGYRGGTHAWLEKLIKRKLFWGICMIHTNELPLCHLIISLDGPTSSKSGFTGPVCSLLSKVNGMQFNPDFRRLPEGESLVEIPDKVVKQMSTDQALSYKLVAAVKSGVLPPELQEVQCGKICHARWLTTAQSLTYLWTRKHGLAGKELKTLEILVRFCLTYYFKLYYDIKVRHNIVEGPVHILTQIRILQKQPKIVRDIITPYIRTGA